MEKSWALPVGQYRLQAWPFAVYLTDWLSILLRYNGFTGIQKAVLNQPGCRPPNSDCDLFLVHVWLWERFGSSFWSSNWAGHQLLLYKIHFLSHITIQQEMAFFFFFQAAHEAPTYWAFFTFQIIFKCWITIEWPMLSSLATSHVLIRGSTSMMALSWSLSTSDGRPLHCSSSRLSSALQIFLNQPYTVCLLAVPQPTSCAVDVVSCLHCFMTHFELKYENHWNLLFI